jgi:hypothetical protein
MLLCKEPWLLGCSSIANVQRTWIAIGNQKRCRYCDRHAWTTRWYACIIVRRLQYEVHQYLRRTRALNRVDLIETKRIDLSGVRFFVLDEADSLLSQGTKDMLMKVYKALTTPAKLQTLLFSATLHSPEMGALAEEVCRFPMWVDLKGKDSVPEVRHALAVHCAATFLAPVTCVHRFRLGG